MLRGKRLKQAELEYLKNRFCKAKFGFGPLQICSSAGIVVMQVIISCGIVTQIFRY